MILPHLVSTIVEHINGCVLLNIPLQVLTICKYTLKVPWYREAEKKKCVNVSKEASETETNIDCIRCLRNKTEEVLEREMVINKHASNLYKAHHGHVDRNEIILYL